MLLIDPNRDIQYCVMRLVSSLLILACWKVVGVLWVRTYESGAERLDEYKGHH